MPTMHPKTQDQKNHKTTQQTTQQQKSPQTQGTKKQAPGTSRGAISRFEQELPETRMSR
jgi:hypothetical protein